jgi:MFS family permease
VADIPEEAGSMGARAWPLMAVVTFALLIDYFIYGLVTPHQAHASDHGGYAAGVLIASPVFGYLSVRIGLKRSMICGVALSAAATALFAIAPSAPRLLAQLLQGTASAATWTAGLSLVARHHAERRVEMMGYALIGSTVGTLLGDVAGSLLQQIGGAALPFLVAGLLVAIDAGLRIFVLPSEWIGSASFAGLGALLLDRSVLIPAAVVGLASLGWSVVDLLLPAELGRAGVAPAVIGLIFVSATIVYGLCAPLVEWVSERASTANIIAAATLAMGLSLPLLGVVQGSVATGAAVCVISLCYAFMLDPTTAELGNAVDRRSMACYSAVYAVFNVTYAIGMMAADAASSAAAAHLSLAQVLLCVSAALVVAAPLIWRKV